MNNEVDAELDVLTLSFPRRLAAYHYSADVSDLDRAGGKQRTVAGTKRACLI